MAHPLYKQVKLSSKHTNLSVFGMIAMVLILPVIVFAMLGTDRPLLVQLLAIVFVLGISAFGVFLTIKMAHAEIRDNVFYLRKVFGKEEQYALEDLKAVKSYDSGKETYIFFTMEKQGKKDTYLVYASHVFYLAEKRNAEQILRDILAENQTK